MRDLNEEFEVCDWCGDDIKDIGPAVSGFMFHLYHVYLCKNPKCGHEMELKPYKIDPDSWVEIPYPI